MGVGLHGVVEHQSDHVHQVLAVDLVDLELAQQQVGGADRGMLVLEAPAQVDRV